MLVCGDIAYSGKEAEYLAASEFLKALCDLIDLEESMVFLVPGNHDVDQNYIKGNTLLSLLQSEIEKNTASQIQISSTIEKYLNKPDTKEIIFSHLSEYNKFSEKYGCSINALHPTWNISIPLGEYILKIYGLNSVMISSVKDHIDKCSEKKMVIGEYQVPLRKPNTINLTLCHHPPDCWNDPNGHTQDFMNNRSHIQFYGHKHTPTIAFNTPVSSLTISSGAMQPSRSEDGWSPYYNLISLEIVSELNKVYLKVHIYPRKYNLSTFKFDSDSDACDSEVEYAEYKVYIEDILQGETVSANKIDTSVEDMADKEIFEESKSISQFILMKTAVYSFLCLPIPKRYAVLNKFNLSGYVERMIDNNKWLKTVMSKVMEQNLLDDFIEEIKKQNI